MNRNTNAKNPFEGAPVIYSYTRKQAIEDGVLVDITEWSRESGFTIPVACTTAVWHQYIVPPKGTTELGQSERGRCHDVLWMLHMAIKGSRGGDQLHYKVVFLNEKRQHEAVKLKAICGPGDEGEPVLTILTPNED